MPKAHILLNQWYIFKLKVQWYCDFFIYCWKLKKILAIGEMRSDDRIVNQIQMIR